MEREFLAARRKRQLDAMYERLLERYRVTIERRAGAARRRRAPSSPRPRSDTPGEAAPRGSASWPPATRPAEAHELRPGFLELRETGPGIYGFLWKKPAGGEVEIYIAPIIPGCRLATPGQQQLTPGALLVRGTLHCDGGLAGKTLAIDGLESTVTDVIVRVHHADGRLESHLLKPVNPSVTLGAQTTGWQRAARISASASSTSSSASTTCCSCSASCSSWPTAGCW